MPTITLSPHNSASKEPYVKISDGRLNFRKDAIAACGINHKTSVKLEFNDETGELDMTFSEDKPSRTNALFNIHSKKKGQFAVSVQGLTNHIPGLREALAEGKKAYMERRRGNTWCIKIDPPPEWITAKGIKEIPSGEYGIYKYLLKGKVVYIGEGILRERAREHKQKGWKYDTYQYALIESKKKGVKLEADLLKEHRQEHNGLNPRYNKNNGKQEKE
nr:hypothetical protein 24 [bacterium]